MKARKKKAAQRAAKRITEMKEKIATNAEHKKAEVVDSTEKTTAAKDITKKEVKLPEVKVEPVKEDIQPVPEDIQHEDFASEANIALPKTGQAPNQSALVFFSSALLLLVTLIFKKKED